MTNKVRRVGVILVISGSRVKMFVNRAGFCANPTCVGPERAGPRLASLVYVDPGRKFKKRGSGTTEPHMPS